MGRLNSKKLTLRLKVITAAVVLALLPVAAIADVYFDNVYADLFTGSFTGDLTGNADTATELAETPTQCDAGEYATGIDTFGNLTCAVVDGLPSQTGNNGKYLTTDGTDPSWATMGGGTWGSITGTLSDQTDLQTALNAKAPLASPSFTGTVTLDTGLTGILKAAAGVVSAGLVDLASEITGTLGISNGGTGQTTKTAAFDALAPSVAKGSTIVGNGTNNVEQLACPDDEMRVADNSTTTGWRCQTANLSLKTDPKNYTPTLTNFGSATPTLSWWRDGNTLSLSGTISIGSGGSGSAGRISLPPGLTIAGSNRTVYGSHGLTLASSGHNYIMGTGGNTYITLANGDSTGAAGTDLGGSWADSSTLYIQASGIPITEWAQATTVDIFEAGDYDDAPYTPTLTGFGGYTLGRCVHSKRGKKLLIDCKVQSGTPTTTEARLSLPGTLLSDSSISGTEYAGQAVPSVATTNQTFTLREGGVGYITFGAQNGSNSGLNKLNADDFSANGRIFSIKAEVPIQGWSTFPLGVAVGKPYMAGFANAGSSGSDCTSSPCTVHLEAGPTADWVSSVTRSGTGNYRVNFQSGIFPSAPVCMVNGGSSTNGSYNSCSFEGVTGVASTSYMDIECRKGDTLSDAFVQVTCFAQ